MNAATEPGRRTWMKWCFASATLPVISQALTSAEAGVPAPPEKSESGSSTLALPSGVQLFYREDWLGAPWLDGEPMVFLHGNQENGAIWYGWVPRMAQRFRLYRLDLPGFGRSKVPADFEWSLASFTKTVADFLDAIGATAAHIVGAKTGGAIAMQFAATYPQRTRTLVVASGPFSSVDPKMEASPQNVRLGSAATKEEMAFFDKLKTETRPETSRGVRSILSSFNLENLLPKISARSLIITSDRSALQSVETVLRFQPKIPNSRLLVLTSDAYHVAVANANECVTNVLAFVDEGKAGG